MSASTIQEQESSMAQEVNSTDNTTIQHSDDSSFQGGVPSSEVNTIYTATYSGIKVIEMTAKGVAVMRRRNDSSFNATQILKVAGIDKARRTKILEKEIHTGTHEKVQGGYGKFQGTWIPYDRAVALAQQYGVYDELKPLFLYNASSAEAIDTPSKEQAMAAQKKRSAHASFNDSLQGLNGLLSASTIRQPSTISRSYSTLTENDDRGEQDQRSNDSPPKKQKLNSDEPQENTNGQKAEPIQVYDHDIDIENPNVPFTLEPISGFIPEFEHSKEIITQIFLNHDKQTLLEVAGGEENLKKVNLDVSIDELGHTALHWAASLARIPLVKELISNGSVRIRGNSNGETPLIRAVLVTNNYDNGTFNELLNLLYPCILLFDHQRRSVLHHIALTAGIKRRSAASRYYLETLLEWIVKVGPYLKKGSITLGKFMNSVVNSQDRNGDTCLNIAARIGNKAIVQQLLDVGADPSIPNKAGLRPIDFGINLNGLTSSVVAKTTTSSSDLATNANIATASGQSSQKILDSMQQVLLRLDSDFKVEISSKQKKIDELHGKLRESTVQLSDARKRLESLKDSEIKLNELKQKIANVDKAISEEEQRFIAQTTELGSIGNYDVDFDADEPFRVWPIFNEFETQLENKVPIDQLKFSGRNTNPSDIPPSVVLKARITAYKENEEKLMGVINSLKEGSETLESKFRRVVALCTGVEESKIDGILDGLVQAVESDPDEVDMGRVVGFLRKVDDKAEA